MKIIKKLGVVIAMSGALTGVARAEDEFSPPAPVSNEATAVEATSAEATQAEEAAAAPRAPAASRFIEEVVITAQKREENLQTVPISVQAFSADRLDAVGISNVKDLPLLTPGLTVTETSGFSLVYIRGVGSDTFLMGDPNVATYIDGVYLPFAAGAAQELSGLERIEVLKGPQGTLFGRGANGGAINILTKDPSFSPELSTELSYDSFNTVGTKVYGNLPFGDTVALNLSALYRTGDHYYNEDSRAGGLPLPKISAQAARVKMLWRPTDDIDVILSVLRSLNEGTSSGLQGNSEPSLLAQVLGVRPQTGYTVINDSPAFIHSNNLIYSATARWETDWFDVKAMGSQQDGELALFIDFDGAPQPIANFGTKTGGDNDVTTAEFQIISNDNSWGSDWLKFNGGFYYVDWYSALDPVFLALGGIDLSTGVENATISLPPGFVEALDALLQPLLGIGVPSGQVRLVGATSLESKAVYAQTTVSFTDWLSLTLGGRYQEEVRKLVESSSGLGDTNLEPVIFIQRYRDRQKTTTSFKPKVSIEGKPFSDDSLLVYLSYQQAIKGPQYNVINIYDPPELVKAETMDAYELGVKSRLFGYATLNASVFYYDITNLQVQFVSLLKGGAVTQENAGGARIKGAEFDLLAPLFPDSIDGLTLVLNGTYLDGKYSEYESGSGFDPVTGLLTNNNDFTGNRITRTPEFSGTMGLSKATTVTGGSLEVSADLYYTTSFYYLAQNQPQDKEDAYAVVNARVSYLYEPWNLRTTLFGRNLTDTQYNYGRFHVDFGTADYLAPPMSYGIQLGWQF